MKAAHPASLAELQYLTRLYGINSVLDASCDKFYTLDDIFAPALPSADAVLCRDLLTELSYEDAHQVISSLTQMASTYLLCSTFPSLPRNRNTTRGCARPLNMAIAPFNWGQPVLTIRESRSPMGTAGAAYLGLWRAEQVRARILQTIH